MQPSFMSRRKQAATPSALPPIVPTPSAGTSRTPSTPNINWRSPGKDPTKLFIPPGTRQRKHLKYNEGTSVPNLMKNWFLLFRNVQFSI
ncbi:unnamed protein product [Ilex paraguariensis]|uniref:Uncharacterized protein n=1 Tax=Ilex paraguariensis TaxID=185542 RepID=A0ABC8U6N0_9AQUA